MDKQKLIDLLNSKPHENIEIKILDQDGIEIEIEDYGFSSHSYSFRFIVNVPNEVDILQEIDSAELLEAVESRGFIETCCDCDIGWLDHDFIECPMCKLKETVKDGFDNIEGLIADLKGEVDG